MDRADIDEALMPGVRDPNAQYGGWLKLGPFEPIDRTWLTANPELARTGEPVSAGALSNQTTPIVVRRLTSTRRDTTRVWWVCQGATYNQARDLGILWAPNAAKDGHGREFWRALQDARPADIVLHYANGALQAVGTVTDEAVEAPRTSAVSGD